MQILWANRAGMRLWESEDLAELCGRDLGADTTDAMRYTIYVNVARLLAGEEVVELATLFPRGVHKRVRLTHHLVHLPDGAPAVLTEAEVEPAGEQLVQLAAQLSFLLVLFDEEGTRRWSRARTTSSSPRSAGCASSVWSCVASRGPTGRQPGPSSPRRVLAAMFDVTTQRRERAELLRLANTDALTSLANRHGVLLEAERRFQRGEQFDVLYVDLDGLKQINDSLGHRYGDLALEAAAKRIASALPEDGFAGRMGGDEFAAFVHADGDGVAERMRGFLSMPYRLDGVRVILTASIGVATHGDVVEGNLEDRIRRADAAMLEAKRSGRNRVQVAASSSLDAERRIRRINRMLPEAVRRREFRLVVQPIVRIADGRIARGECLIRWSSPELGEVSPMDFIPVAEQSGIIRDIGRTMLSGAADLLRTLEDAGRAVPLAVNLSAREVVLPTLSQDLREELLRTGVRPALLGVELTESAMIGRWDLARANLDQVRALGVGVALDDFGTGYSALAVVHQLQVDTLKLDRSLVKDLPAERAVAVARAIVRMADSLGTAVVAEGVETQAQADALREMGCVYGQGWLWSTALEVPAFVARLTADQIP
jgi:diguanylate cyclase (GGDEF)-like protein